MRHSPATTRTLSAKISNVPRNCAPAEQQRELQQAKIQEEASEDESEEEPVAPTKSKASFFANLAALEDEEEEEEEEDGAEEKVDVPRPSADLSDDPTPTFTAKRSKKSKKKKKAKNKKPAEKEKHMNGADDIDAALRELDLKPPSGGDSLETTKISTDPEYERVCALLGINTQHLKVANEMRNLFGRTAVDNNDDAGGPVGRGGRRRQRGQQQQVDLETALKGHHAPGKGLSELTLRRNNFIQGKDDWPRGTTGGLTMEMVDDRAEDGTVEFRYVHDQAYQTLQQAFHGYVEMGDPQNLIGLLTRNRKSHHAWCGPNTDICQPTTFPFSSRSVRSRKIKQTMPCPPTSSNVLSSASAEQQRPSSIRNYPKEKLDSILLDQRTENYGWLDTSI
jgi:hypothetical protein